MQPAYLHVVVNHLPIMGVPLALAALALGAWARSEGTKRAALLLLVGLGVATIAVYALGQAGEDFVEHLPGVSEEAIEAHEDMAGNALAATLALAALSLAAFVAGSGLGWLARKDPATLRRVPAWGTAGVLLLGGATTAILGFTGKLGGQIRHVEFVDPALAADHESEAEDDEDHGRGRGRGGRR